MGALAGDQAFSERFEYLIEELSKVQEAIGDGYLSAFPKEHFTRLQSLQPVWAPFYVVRSSSLSPPVTQNRFPAPHCWSIHILWP